MHRKSLRKPLLFVDSISISYQKSPTTPHANNNSFILNDFSMKIFPGEICCLLGASGCGKTSLLKAIAGFLPVVKGKISLDGSELTTPLKILPPDQRNITMAFQDHALFPHLTVQKNILFGLQYGKFHFPKQEKKNRFLEIVHNFSLPHLLHKYPHQLSGGENQRVALARAILPNPKLLLLDEPFASQDVTLKEKLLTTLNHVLKRDKMTCLIVTHDQMVGFSISHKLGVVYNKHLAQLDAPYKIYHAPTSFCVADFVGNAAFLPARLHENKNEKPFLQTEFGPIHNFSLLPNGCACCSLNPPSPLSSKNQSQYNNQWVQILVRPDDVSLQKIVPNKKYNPTLIHARIAAAEFKGPNFLYQVLLKSDNRLLALMPSHAAFQIDEIVNVNLNISHPMAFKI